MQVRSSALRTTRTRGASCMDARRPRLSSAETKSRQALAGARSPGGTKVRPGGRLRGGRHTHRNAPCRVERSGRRTPQHTSRNGAEPRRSFGFIGKTVKTWAAQGPVWDSSIAREAGSTKDAAMLSSMACDARRCQPLVRLTGSSSPRASGGMGASRASHATGGESFGRRAGGHTFVRPRSSTSLTLASSCPSQECLPWCCQPR